MLHPNTSVTIPFAPAVASLYWWTSYFVSWFSVVDRKWCPTATSVDIGMIKGCHKRKQQIWQYWSNIGKQILLEQSQPYENQPLHTTATSLNVKQRLILMAALAGHSCHWPLAEKLDSHLPTLLDSRFKDMAWWVYMDPENSLTFWDITVPERCWLYFVPVPQCGSFCE